MSAGLYYERKYCKLGYDLIIGIDEAGRGSLAGPVVAAACALSDLKFRNRIDDSKKLTPEQRETAYFEIVEKSVYGIGIISDTVIEKLNILKATLIAMEHAVENLLSKITAQPRILLLIDGNMGIDVKLDTECIIDGDCKSKSIAAASILAKVTRDRMMRIYDKAYPQYGFSAHKGYGTPEHISNIKKYGLSQIHRLKFCDDFLPEGNLESDAGLI